MNKELKITPPENYEIDKENSTLEHIKFKKIENKEINSFEDACEYLNIKTYGDIYKVLGLKRKMFSSYSATECDDEFLILATTICALNGGVNLKITDKRWYLWFYVTPFSLNDVCYYVDDSYVPLALALKAKELAEFAGKHKTISKYFENYILSNQ